MIDNERHVVVHENDVDEDGHPTTWALCACGAIWQADGTGPLGNSGYRRGAPGVTLEDWTLQHVCLDEVTTQRFRDLFNDARHVTGELLPAVSTKVTRFCRASIKLGIASIHGSQDVVDDLAEFEDWMAAVRAMLERLDDYLDLDEPADRHLYVVRDSDDGSFTPTNR